MTCQVGTSHYFSATRSDSRSFAKCLPGSPLASLRFSNASYWEIPHYLCEEPMVNIPRTTQSPTPSEISPSENAPLKKATHNPFHENTPTGALSAIPLRKHRSDEELNKGSDRPTFRSSPVALAEAHDSTETRTYTSKEVEAMLEEKYRSTVDTLGGHQVKIARDLVKLNENLGETLVKLQSAMKLRDERTKAQKAASRARGKDTKQKIKSLSEENKDLKLEIDALKTENEDFESELMGYSKIVDDLSGQISHLKNHSESLLSEIKQKSETIEKRNESIRSDRNSKAVLRQENEDLIKMKDMEISGLHEKLDEKKSEIDRLNAKNEALQLKFDAVDKTASGLTKGKTKTLVDSGKRIQNESDVLRTLNSKLIEENSDNKKQIAILKEKIVLLAGKLGINLEP
ncbi:hypothetical protein [Burkholderia stabilis]|uniref:hypothetical protein n=1 Tax=Burkholderia stabilis TaxID=95485 RepID=UPI00158B6E96|nr:hypothetical protein [Burkholderia stabilis]